MQKSVQAALYSALIFPGAGLYWLKRYWQAALFILPALAISAYVLRAAMISADQLRDKISSGALPLDVVTLTLEVQRSVEQLTASLDSSITWLIICWGLSIGASYLAGRKLERGPL
jgi:hypothetical protein